MHGEGEGGSSQGSRLSYRSPEIERIGSIADITAANGQPGTDSFFGYAGQGNQNFPPS